MIQGEPRISDNEVEEEEKLSSATVLEVPKPCGICGENQASEEKDESDVETKKEELLMLEKEEKLLQAQQEKALLRQKLREKREAVKALKEYIQEFLPRCMTWSMMHIHSLRSRLIEISSRRQDQQFSRRVMK